MDNLCIGTAQFGMDYGVANKRGKPSQKEIYDIVRLAIRESIFYFDTAQAYGDSEIVLGNAIKYFNFSSKIKCITKLLPDYKFDNYKNLRKCIFDSIKKLNVNQLYALLLHRLKIKGDWDNFLSGVRQLKTEGLIEKFGVSIYDPDDAVKFGKEAYIDILQIPFNVLDRRLIERDFFNLAAKNKKEIFLRSIYLQGLLLIDHDRIISKQMDWAIPYIEILTEYCNRHQLNRKEFIIKAVQFKAPKARIIFGIESKKQLAENISLINSNIRYQAEINKWWNDLPLLPDKFLDPSLWSTHA